MVQRSLLIFLGIAMLLLGALSTLPLPNHLWEFSGKELNTTHLGVEGSTNPQKQREPVHVYMTPTAPAPGLPVQCHHNQETDPTLKISWRVDGIAIKSGPNHTLSGDLFSQGSLIQCVVTSSHQTPQTIAVASVQASRIRAVKPTDKGAATAGEDHLELGETQYLVVKKEDLWLTHGTTQGSRPIKNVCFEPEHPIGCTLPHGIPPAQDAPAETRGIEFRGKLYFSSWTKQSGHELWVSDKSKKGAELFRDLVPGEGSSSPSDFFIHGDLLYISTQNADHNQMLWVSDGQDVVQFESFSSPHLMQIDTRPIQPTPNRHYFVVSTDEHQDKIFVLD